MAYVPEFRVELIKNSAGETVLLISTRVERNTVIVTITYTYNPLTGILTSDYGQEWKLAEGQTVGMVLDLVMAMHKCGPGNATLNPYIPVAVEVPINPPYRPAA